MDHSTAVEAKMGQKYLLGELTAAQEDEFAEHFFDCEECAGDLRMNSVFLETAKKVLAEDRARPPRVSPRWRSGGWNPLHYAVAASIALCAFMLYQNAVTIPALRQALAPQALAYFPLTSMGARGGDQTAIHPETGKPFVLLVEIQPQPGAAEYRAQILNQGGTQVVAIAISEQMASRTIPLLIPASTLQQGQYSLALSSRSSQSAPFVEFERYPLQVQ